ncbi:hypothetical protein F5888DRAFT_1634396 [Russula emetica]|nr:hypothetical protein F5888DRAFT_1634396 [Russula emetica]
MLRRLRATSAKKSVSQSQSREKRRCCLDTLALRSRWIQICAYKYSVTRIPGPYIYEIPLAVRCQLARVLRLTHFAPPPMCRAVLQMKQGAGLEQRSPSWDLQANGGQGSTATAARDVVACSTEASVASVIPAAQERARLMTSQTATCPGRVKLEITASKPGKGSCDAEARAPGVNMRLATTFRRRSVGREDIAQRADGQRVVRHFGVIVGYDRYDHWGNSGNAPVTPWMYRVGYYGCWWHSCCPERNVGGCIITHSKGYHGVDVGTAAHS